MKRVGETLTTLRRAFAMSLLAALPGPALAAGGTLTICAEHADPEGW